MQYTGTVAMFNSQLRRDRLGGLQEEQRPANNMIQYDLPPQEKKARGRPSGHMQQQQQQRQHQDLTSPALLRRLLQAREPRRGRLS